VQKQKNHYLKTIKLKDKIKYALKYPQEIFSHVFSSLTNLFLNKEQCSLKFFKNWFLNYKPDFLFSKLREYWNKYRYLTDILKYIGVNQSEFNKKKILDIGCGYTSVLNILPGGERYGIDIVINSLKKNNFPLNKEIKWINGDAEKLPFENNFFDIVFCSNGIDHYKNPHQTLSETKRVLKNKGFFILTIDIFDKDLGYRNTEHPHSYTQNKIINELQLYGFDILFMKKSPIDAQFFMYMKNNIIINREEKELVMVMRLNK